MKPITFPPELAKEIEEITKPPPDHISPSTEDILLFGGFDVKDLKDPFPQDTTQINLGMSPSGMPYPIIPMDTSIGFGDGWGGQLLDPMDVPISALTDADLIYFTYIGSNDLINAKGVEVDKGSSQSAENNGMKRRNHSRTGRKGGNERPSFLPDDWTIICKHRKNGTKIVDKFYEDPTGRRFRSGKEVKRYLETSMS